MDTSLRSNPFAPFLAADTVVVLDGGLATALEERGHRLDSELWSAKLLVDDPDAIRAVHRAYLRAGADCITTASYQASLEGFAAAGLGEAEAVELLWRSSELAIRERDALAPGGAWDLAAPAEEVGTSEGRLSGRRAARDGETARPRPLVAASVGPYGAYLADGSEYDGRYGISGADLERFHRRRFRLLASTGVDLLACETIPSGAEARVLLDILDDVPGAWAWMSFACRDGRRLHDGTPIEEAVGMMTGRERVAAVGVNCTAPRHVPELVARARSVTELPLIAYPNSGERYDAAMGSWLPAGADEDDGPRRDPWLAGVLEAIDAGAAVVGGCCRVGPDDIAELRRTLRDRG